MLRKSLKWGIENGAVENRIARSPLPPDRGIPHALLQDSRQGFAGLENTSVRLAHATTLK
jgi:hypothetical protein